MEINRNYYLQKLIDHKFNGMVKIVTGVRRCGKSYLLFNLFYRHLIDEGICENHIIKVSLDDYGNKNLLKPEELYNYVKSKIQDRGQYYILLDEIQLVPNFESVVNGFLHIGNVDIYVTGSNSKFLSSDVVTEFRGRGDEIRVYPLSFAEFYSALEKNTPFNKAWLQYATYGGMPLCLSMKNETDKIKYLTSLFETTYLEDIINRHNLRGNAEINELTDVLASCIGALTNPLKLSNTFNSENVIYNELKLRGYSVDVGVVEIHSKENGVSQRKQLEVDFVVNLGNRRYYIQSAYILKSIEKSEQEQASLLNINDGFKKIIIVNEEIMTGYNEQGILIASLSDFLLDPEKTLNW